MTALGVVGMWGKRHLGRLLRGEGVRCRERYSRQKEQLTRCVWVGQGSGSRPGLQVGGGEGRGGVREFSETVDKESEGGFWI